MPSFPRYLFTVLPKMLVFLGILDMVDGTWRVLIPEMLVFPWSLMCGRCLASFPSSKVLVFPGILGMVDGMCLVFPGICSRCSQKCLFS